MVISKGPENRYDLIVAGGGPIGSYMAYRSAKIGSKVLLIDKKNEIGRPTQCAGLVNVELFTLPGLDAIKENVTLKEIYGADIFSPSGDLLPLRGTKVKALSIDRSAFDLELLRMAARSGADVMMGTKVISATRSSDGGCRIEVKKGNEKEILRSSFLIGCDGPTSTIRKEIGLSNPQDTIPGINMEIVIKDATIPDRLVGVLTGNETARGFFSWAIPSFGKNGLRVGLSARCGMDVRKGLDHLSRDQRLASFLALDKIEKDSISTITSVYGSVPMGTPSKIFKDDFILIGDSAGMAKPTSGGGIYPGMRAVNYLTDILADGGYKPGKTFKQFTSVWKRGYGRELTKGMILRKIIREMGDEDIDKAIRALNDERKLKLINETGDIDQPVSLAVKLLKMDPSLLMLIPRYLPHLKGLF